MAAARPPPLPFRSPRIVNNIVNKMPAKTHTHPAHKTLYATIHIYTFIVYTDGQTKLAVVRCSFYLALPKGLAMAREFLI